MQKIRWVWALCCAVMLSGCAGVAVQPDQPTPDQQRTIDLIRKAASDDAELDALVTQLAATSKRAYLGEENKDRRYNEVAAVIRDIRYDAERNALILVADTPSQDTKVLPGKTMRSVCRNPILYTLINKTRVIYIIDLHYRGKEVNGEYQLGAKEYSTIVDYCG